MSEEATSNQRLDQFSVGWIGAGRMGYAMARRLLLAGADVAVYNRTRAKAEPLQADGASVVDHPSDLAGRDIVFTMVSGPEDLKQVICGDNGLLSAELVPRLVVDCSSVSEEGSLEVREALRLRGCEMLSSPVSGNAKVVAAGRLTVVVSGPESSYELAVPYLEALGEGVTYVGEGELARMVKICHNVLLGVVTQSLAEIAVLAEKGGVPRHALLDFINHSVMGSIFSTYKTPAMVKLDWTPTFTPLLLRKDMDLGLAAGEKLNVPMPVAEMTRSLVQKAIDAGHTDCDFAILLAEQANASGLDLQPENVEVDDGLH